MQLKYAALTLAGCWLLRRVLSAGYSKSGPFSNNSPPPFNASFGNNVENYLVGLNANKMNFGGPVALTNAGTTISHGLGTTPVAVFALGDGTAGSNVGIQVDHNSFNGSTFKLYSTANISAFWLAIA